MTGLTEPDGTKKPFLDAKDAEVVSGPDVIAAKVSGALQDADRFDVQSVKPPLSEALGKARRAGAPTGADDGAAEQNALSGASAEVDESAGSAEMLKPAERAGSA